MYVCKFIHNIKELIFDMEVPTYLQVFVRNGFANT